MIGFVLKLLGKGESVELAVDRSPPPNAKPLFHIRYEEDFGAMTRRDIFPIRMYATEEGVRAWCYLMGEMRLFKFSQLHGVHDNLAGRDIKARGLWEWCGLPATDVVFPDEEPQATKQSQWQRTPSSPRFRIVFRPPGGQAAEHLFSPVAWGSHRRTMRGVSWPKGEQMEIDFAWILESTDLETGEVLDRMAMWKLVLDHREDSPPWYVQWADQHLSVLCMIGFARQEAGRFTAKMRSSANDALVLAGFAPLDEDGFKSISQAVKEGYDGYSSLDGWVKLLGDKEREACLAFAHSIHLDKQGDQSLISTCFGKPKPPQ